VIPLIQFTSDRAWMGEFANGRVVKALAWLCAAVILSLNGWLVFGAVRDAVTSPEWPLYSKGLLVLVVGAVAALLVYVIAAPGSRRLARAASVASEPASWVKAPAVPHTYGRIAIALAADASDASVLAHGISLGRSYNATVLVVHVAEGFGARYFGGTADNLETRDDREYLDRVREEVVRSGLNAEAHLLYGEPADQLIRMVERENIDLLVMGAHGHGPFGDILFGSTVSPVRHRVRIPVFVVRSERT
jgi:manganese transport protein